MDESVLRHLAVELLAELADVVPEAAERTAVTQALVTALAAPDGQGRAVLLEALSTHLATRRWMRDHGANDDVVRASLPGQATAPIGLYYVCPQEDEDLVLINLPALPPLCTTHGIPMVLEQG
jgi:hypothetical protein